MDEILELTEEERAYLTSRIPNLDLLLLSDDPNDFYLAIDDEIIDELDETQNDLSSEGVKLQRMRDRIFERNEY